VLNKSIYQSKPRVQSLIYDNMNQLIPILIDPSQSLVKGKILIIKVVVIGLHFIARP
jgi:hypothetical protein